MASDHVIFLFCSKGKASPSFWHWAKYPHRQQFLERKRTIPLSCKGHRMVVKVSNTIRKGRKAYNWHGGRKTHWKPGETFCSWLGFHTYLLTLLMFTSSTMLPSPGWSFTLNVCWVCNLGMFTVTIPEIGLELTTSKIDSISRLHCWALFTEWRGTKNVNLGIVFIYLLVNMVSHQRNNSNTSD